MMSLRLAILPAMPPRTPDILHLDRLCGHRLRSIACHGRLGSSGLGRDNLRLGHRQRRCLDAVGGHHRPRLRVRGLRDSLDLRLLWSLAGWNL
jgi:hypothetical protein